MSSTIKRNFQIATAEQMHHFKIVKAGGLMKGRYLKNCYFRAEILNLSNLNIVHDRLTKELILNAHNILQHKQDLVNRSRIVTRKEFTKLKLCGNVQKRRIIFFGHQAY